MNKDIYSALNFKIGEHLEIRKHEVIPIPPVGNLEVGIHPYEYFGEINKILNLPTSRILLFYKSQMLVKVMLVFKRSLQKSLIEMLENLDAELPNELLLSIQINESADCIELVYHSGILK